MKKKFIIPLALGTIIVASVLFMKTRPGNSINIQKTPAHASMTAVNLLKAYEDNEQEANDNYGSKVLEVRGSLKNVQSISENEFRLTLEAESAMGGVVCNMQSKHKLTLEDLRIGDVVSVKGLCTGYMFDVVLDESIIIN